MNMPLKLEPRPSPTIMTSTPKSHPSVQRFNNAYVQVPQSPHNLSSYQALGTPFHVVARGKLKENAPMNPSQAPMGYQAPSFALLKRKVSDIEPSLILDGSTNFKKMKMDPRPLKETQVTPLALADAHPDFPNGFAYCHQCGKRRDALTTIRCTFIERFHTTKTTKERSCTYKYCKSCLKNRYNEDIDSMKSPNGIAINFKCPRCRDICNCPKCRTLKGLDPTGVMAKPKAKETSETKPKKTKVEVVISISGKSREIVKAKPRPKEVIKPKDLPVLMWTSVPVHLSKEEADDRIFIREFILRFSPQLDPAIAKTHQEELELIGGRFSKSDEDNITGWVSEACIRALVLGLLGLLQKDHKPHIAQVIKTAIKNIRSAGSNMNKLWSNLISMRSQVADATGEDGSCSSSSKEKYSQFTFPDPSPPPASTVARARSLRSVHKSNELMNVVHSAQMIPVIVSLINSALATAIIREEIDQGNKEFKEFTRDAKEATRIESERWESERSTLENKDKDKTKIEENKAKRTAHKDQVANIDNCLKIITPAFVSRFATLGTDNDGRIYYALSPGLAEREAAFEYLEAASSEEPYKRKRKQRILSQDERLEMRDWSWFVVVYGKRPPLLPVIPKPNSINDGNTSKSMEGSNEENEDEDIDEWWAFWEAGEIQKVADWISIKSGLEDIIISNAERSGDKNHAPPALSPRMEQLKHLVADLKNYASILQWRACEDKCTLIPRVAKNALAVVPQQSN